jgi:hypothetical protein
VLVTAADLEAFQRPIDRSGNVWVAPLSESIVMEVTCVRGSKDY